MQGQVLKIAYAVSFNHKLAQLRHLPLHQTHFEFEGELPIWNKFCELIAHTYIHSVRNYVLSLSGDNQAFDMKTAFAGASLFKLTWNAELMKSLRTNAQSNDKPLPALQYSFENWPQNWFFDLKKSHNQTMASQNFRG